MDESIKTKWWEKKKGDVKGKMMKLWMTTLEMKEEENDAENDGEKKKPWNDGQDERKEKIKVR